MSEKRAVIIGSGIAGTTVATELLRKRFQIDMYEKGPPIQYPAAQRYLERTAYGSDAPSSVPADLKNVDQRGDFPAGLLDGESQWVVGGSAAHWEGIALRMTPDDFRTKGAFGYGNDWPVTYGDLEPYYCKAEWLIGVSGTDSDNPFAPPRSRPFPLREFELSYADRTMAERLGRAGIKLHTTPQARAREAYDGRPGCQNFSECDICPIGARYSPTHHHKKALETGRFRIHPETSVRRIILDRGGSVRAVLVQGNESTRPVEQPADVVIVAAGALENARLLLLSKGGAFPDGVGNRGGHVGKHLSLHHIWFGVIEHREPVYPGRVGPPTGQSHQFVNPKGRGVHGGLKLEFSHPLWRRSDFVETRKQGKPARPFVSGQDVVDDLRHGARLSTIGYHAESVSDARTYVALSDRVDRFGDPFVMAHCAESDFTRRTYDFARKTHETIVAATGSADYFTPQFSLWSSGYHHMATTRMGTDESEGVVDPYGKVHGCGNLYVAGSSIFRDCGGSVNPTLTIVALALRTAERIAARHG